MYKKRILALLLSVCMVGSVMPQTALVVRAKENTGETLETAWNQVSDNELKMSLDDGNSIEAPWKECAIEEDWYDSEELYEGYAAQLFAGDNGISAFSTHLGDSLTGVNKVAYDNLKAEVKKIADGERISTKINVGDIFGETFYSAEDLGVDALSEIKDGKNYVTSDAMNALYAKAGFNSKVVFKALLYDCPYELYWFDKTLGYAYGASLATDEVGRIRISGFTFSFTVDKNYRAESDWTTNTSKTSAAKEAVANANSILSVAASKSDYQKLNDYKQAICDLVSYNTPATDKTDEDGNKRADYLEEHGLSAWQLVYVFDNDDTTNVVCEGYSKAYQYLCDMTNFNNGDIYAITVTGDMSSSSSAGGGHMWNIMHMDDGKNYLVDITNCDSGSSGYPDKLFMQGYDSTVTNGYRIQISSSHYVQYIYDSDTLNAYASEDLTLPAMDYVEHVFPTDYDNGFRKCETCDLIQYEPAALENDVYHIGNAGQLYWFAGMVNGTLNGVAQNTAANAVLDNDIVVNSSVLSGEGELNGTPEMVWKPIGNKISFEQYTKYQGTFGGQGHSISGLYFNDASTRYVGLFGYNAGTIKNLSVLDSYFAAGGMNGGIAGYNDGAITNCMNAATLVSGTYGSTGGIAGRNAENIELCINYGYINADGHNDVGGISGDTCFAGDVSPTGGSLSTTVAHIKDCINYGKVESPYSNRDVGGICGYVAGVAYSTKSGVFDCVNVGNVIFESTIATDTKALYGSKGFGAGAGTVSNSYYLVPYETGKEGAKTKSKFESGEVTFLLNKENTDGSQAWYQKIGVDTYPTLQKASDNVVYSYSACNGTDIFYSNDSAYDGITINHIFVDGVCSECSYDCVAHEHELNNAISEKVDETKHAFTCSACGKTAESKHDFLKGDAASDITQETCSLCTIKNINYQGLDSKIHVADMPYTGTAQSPTVTIDGLTENVDFTVETISKTDVADDYTVWVSGKENYGGKRQVTWKITKVPASLETTPSARSLTYNGDTQVLIIAGTSLDGTVVYGKSENGTYASVLPTATKAGDYEVWYKVIGDANHEDSTPVKLNVSIAQKSITPTVDITGTYTYSGVAQSPNYTIKDGDIVLTSNDYATNLADNVNAGTAKITFSAKATGNYSFTDKTVEFTILQATPSYIAPSGLTATCHDMLSVVSLPAGFSWIDADEALDAGSSMNGQAVTKKAKFTPVDTANYKTVTDIPITIAVKHGIGIVNGADGQHKYECAKCSFVLREACTGGMATCKDRAICSICHIAYGNKNTGKHVGGTEIKNQKAASCTSVGYTGDTYCKGCGAKTSNGNSIAALGHSFNSGVIESEPTHTSDGTKVYTCVRCNATKTEMLPKLPEEPKQLEQPAEVVQRQNIESFVSRMYTVVLSRAAEDEGKDYWSDELENCTYDGAALASGFVNSAEFQARGLSDEEYVDVLYATFFDREGDEGGKNYWLSEMAKGMDRNEVLAGFVNSKEFGGICEDYGIARGTMEKDGSSIYNPGVRNFVLRNYTKALARDGELEGVEYWSHLINTKQSTALDAAESFFQSQEFKNKNLNDSDYVEVLYETFFGRASDEGGKSYWLSMLAQGNSRDWVLSEFSNSKEFSNIMSEYGL